MANASKNKGDRGEREAIARLAELIPDLLVDGYDRARSAGIPHDRGDLYALEDTAIQVKHWGASSLGLALTEAASGASEQALNARKPSSLGMASIHGARATQVRWLAALTPEMAERLHMLPVADFKMISALRSWVQDDDGPHGYIAHPREKRIGRFLVRGKVTVVSPLEAWAHAYRASVRT